jgi:hypothetical protein
LCAAAVCKTSTEWLPAAAELVSDTPRILAAADAVAPSVRETEAKASLAEKALVELSMLTAPRRFFSEFCNPLSRLRMSW